MRRAVILALFLVPPAIVAACSAPDTHPPLLPDCPGTQCTPVVVGGGGNPDATTDVTSDVIETDATDAESTDATLDSDAGD